MSAFELLGFWDWVGVLVAFLIIYIIADEVAYRGGRK